MQKNALKILSIFTLVFFVMSMTGAAATSTGGKVLEVTKLDQINTALHKGPVFLRLGASWCPHCQKFAPTLKQLAKEYAGKVTFTSIDIDQSPSLAKYFGVLRTENTYTCNRMGKPPLSDLMLELSEIIV